MNHEVHHDDGIYDGDSFAVYDPATQRVVWYANLIGHEVVVTEEVALYSERSQDEGR